MSEHCIKYTVSIVSSRNDDSDGAAPKNFENDLETGLKAWTTSNRTRSIALNVKGVHLAQVGQLSSARVYFEEGIKAEPQVSCLLLFFGLSDCQFVHLCVCVVEITSKAKTEDKTKLEERRRRKLCCDLYLKCYTNYF